MIDKSILRVGDVVTVRYPDERQELVFVVRDGMRPAGVTHSGARAVDLTNVEVLEFSGRRGTLEKQADESVE